MSHLHRVGKPQGSALWFTCKGGESFHLLPSPISSPQRPVLNFNMNLSQTKKTYFRLAPQLTPLFLKVCIAIIYNLLCICEHSSFTLMYCASLFSLVTAQDVKESNLSPSGGCSTFSHLFLFPHLWLLLPLLAPP